MQTLLEKVHGSDSFGDAVKEGDKKAIFGVCAFVAPLFVYAVIMRAGRGIPQVRSTPPGVAVLVVTLSLFSGYAFVLRGWPKQAGLLAFWYFPVMLAALYYFTTAFLGFFVTDYP